MTKPSTHQCICSRPQRNHTMAFTVPSGGHTYGKAFPVHHRKHQIYRIRGQRQSANRGVLPMCHRQSLRGSSDAVISSDSLFLSQYSRLGHTCLSGLEGSHMRDVNTSTIKQIPPIRLHMFVPFPNLCRFFCLSRHLARKPFVFAIPWQSRRFPNRTFAH